MSALESKIDDLYRGPLEEFTSARNALAKTLSGAEAARIRKLAKPTLVPWAINQLYWHARPTYDRLLSRGARLRQTQFDTLEGRRADLRAAADAHRAAIVEAVKETTRLAAAHGAHPAGDAVTRTIEALSLLSTAPDPPGRLTEALAPAGFEALAGVPFREVPRDVAPAAPHERSAKRAKPPRGREAHEPRASSRAAHEAQRRADAEKRDREEARQREADARAHAAAVTKAEATLARARSAAVLTREAADRADKAVADAEADLERLRSARA